MFKRRSLIVTLAIVVATAWITFTLTMRYHDWFTGGPSPTRPMDLSVVAEALQTIRDSYVEPVDEEKLLRAAVEGMVNSLGDKFSNYFTPENWQAFQDEVIEPTYSGIGVSVEDVDGVMTILTVFSGSPAEGAALRPNDQILSANGTSIVGVPIEEAVKLIKGPPGTKVTLRIRRQMPNSSGEQAGTQPGGQGAGQEPNFTEFNVDIVRQTIEYPVITAKIIDQQRGIGYLRIWEFREDMTNKARAALSDLRQQGMKRLVLDLRSNPGGAVNEAEALARLFVPRGPIVTYVSRGGESRTVSSNTSGFDLPFVVLVDEGTASAAEIVAGAIQDRKAAPLIGAKTFGKGSVQSLISLEDGSGMKITIQKYLTPSGRSIHGLGIEPDILVPTPEVAPGQRPVPLDDPANPQLARAIQEVLSR